MDAELNELLITNLANAGVAPTSGAHRLALAIVELIEAEQGKENAQAVVEDFAKAMVDPPTTALDLLHFVSQNIQICPISK